MPVKATEMKEREGKAETLVAGFDSSVHASAQPDLSQPALRLKSAEGYHRAEHESTS